MPTEVINLKPPNQFANLGNVTFSQLVSTAVVFIIVAAAVIFFFMLILGGIRWISSGGDKGQVEQARAQITAALTGLLVVFIIWALISLINSLFGVNLFTLTIPKAFVP